MKAHAFIQPLGAFVVVLDLNAQPGDLLLPL